MTRGSWRIRLTQKAETDLTRILGYTRDTFGAAQAGVYEASLIEAFAALEDGPDVPGSLGRDEILVGLRSLHMARKGRRGRHLIIYRAAEGRVVEVMRILHDQMDLARHIPGQI